LIVNITAEIDVEIKTAGRNEQFIRSLASTFLHIIKQSFSMPIASRHDYIIKKSTLRNTAVGKIANYTRKYVFH